LLWLDAEHRRRGPDDLDDLIDDLFPEVEERPGWLDVGLIVVGAALLTWAATGEPPGFAIGLGIVALGLGIILPVRTAWRRLKQRRQRRHREAQLGMGVPLDASAPAAKRLVQAYESLLRVESAHDAGGSAVAVAHSALLEAASLLKGRAPVSDREDEYLEKRALAIEAFTLVLGEPRVGTSPPSAIDQRMLVDAREELDAIAGFNSISRLEQLTEEERMQRGDGA